VLTGGLFSGIFRERPAPGAVEKRSLGLRLDGYKPAGQRLAVPRCPDPVLQVPCALLLFFDNGRGDITGLADPVTGAVVAHCECSPFGSRPRPSGGDSRPDHRERSERPVGSGNLLVSSGPLASANPYRFSSKEHDATGLAYYGYRYYSPELGRWINRDPMGERGGVNLFGSLKNSPVHYVDPSGLKCCCCCVEKVEADCRERITSKKLADGRVIDVLGFKLRIRMKFRAKESDQGTGESRCSYRWLEWNDDVPLDLGGCLPGRFCDVTKLYVGKFNFLDPDSPEDARLFRGAMPRPCIRGGDFEDTDVPHVTLPPPGSKVSRSAEVRWRITVGRGQNAACASACGGAAAKMVSAKALLVITNGERDWTKSYCGPPVVTDVE
jgi:RHS repeat-associated protein